MVFETAPPPPPLISGSGWPGSPFIWRSGSAPAYSSIKWGVLGLIFAGYVPLAFQSPYPIIVYSVANYSWPHLGSPSLLGKYVIFVMVVTFYFYELTHFLDWMKNILLFICSTNILVCLLIVSMKNFLTPKIWKFATPFDPVVKMRPHPAAHPSSLL